MKKDILLFIIMLCIVGCTNAKTQNENTGTIKPNIIEQKGKEDRFILYANNLDELLEKKEWSIKKLPVLENLNYKGLKIWADQTAKLFPYGYPFSFVANQIHQYILIFRKEK